MLFRDLTVTTTLDGSHTLFVPHLNEHYHSTFGALQESRHVFVEMGLIPALELTQGKDPVKVFEMGFGTALNALLVCLAARAHLRKVDYSAIELHPLEREVWEKLNYPEMVGDPDAPRLFRRMHESPWETAVGLDPCFRLEKLRGDVRSVQLPRSGFHLIFFDAFSPLIQPELWTAEIFGKMFSSLHPGGVLVTYSCKGGVRRTLQEAGFSPEKLPGPPGKREMLRCWKS